MDATVHLDVKPVPTSDTVSDMLPPPPPPPPQVDPMDGEPAEFPAKDEKPEPNDSQCLDQSQPVAGDDLKTLVTKRRRSVLTLQQKLEVIERIKKGEKVTKLATEYGVGKATVSDLKRQEDKIMAFVSKMNSASPQKRKTMRKPQDERIEKALHMWLNREKKKGTQISGPLLMEKAKAFHKQLYGDDNDKFKASTGWLHRFKLRNGIRHQKVPRKKAMNENETANVQAHLDKLRRHIQDNCLSPEQIYTTDKTRLHWRALPFKQANGNDGKPSRDCVIVVGCVNATGSHKLRLAMIGRQKTLSCYGNANVDKMPFRYYSQEDGWLDREVFSEWFHTEFVTSVRSYYEGAGLAARALLLVDDAPLPSEGITLQSEDNNIQCVVVPNIVSFVTQPINSMLFETVKRNYRKKLILRALAAHPGKRLPSHLSDLGKWVALKDAGYMLSEAWGAINSETIRRLWRDTLYCLGAVDEQAVVVDELLKKVDEHGAAYNCNTLGSLVDDAFEIAALLKSYDVTEEDVASWLSLDTEDANSQTPMSDREIIDTVRCEYSGTESDEEKEKYDNLRSSSRRSEAKANDPSTAHVPSDNEAYSCFTKCLSWLENQPDCEPSYLQLLWKLQNMAAQKKHSKR